MLLSGSQVTLSEEQHSSDSSDNKSVVHHMAMKAAIMESKVLHMQIILKAE